jgi:hypothetical protein
MATATLVDMAVLQTDPAFGTRVLASLTVFCSLTLPSEAISAASLPQHVARKNYASQILGNPNNYKAQFVAAAACNQIVANDATVNGTIAALTGAALATQAALCTDADINNAIAAAFNSFIPGI